MVSIVQGMCPCIAWVDGMHVCVCVCVSECVCVGGCNNNMSEVNFVRGEGGVIV